MNSIELIFSILMILLPIIVLITKKNILLYYSLMVVGSNPYVSALSLLITLLVKTQVILKEKMNKYIFFLSFIWLYYGFIIGIYNFSSVFILEYIQLLIGILLTIYIYNSIKNLKELIIILKILVYSGIVLSLFEIFLELFNISINTFSFIGNVPDNYTAFYLVITTILVPLSLRSENYSWLFIIPIGLSAIIINESRAMMLLSILLISIEFISVKNFYYRIFIFIVFFIISITIILNFDYNSIYNSNSIFSVLNFENNFSNMERLKLLIYSYDIFINNPFGYGLGSSYELFTNNYLTVNNIYPHPHNTLAFFLVELGIVGVFIYFYFIYILFVSQIKIKNNILRSFSKNTMLSLILYSIVDVLFYNGILSLFIFSLFALVLVSKKVDKIC